MSAKVEFAKVSGFKTFLCLTTTCGMAMSAISPAFAQAEPQSSARADDEIIVTARKQQESILKVPVVLTAVTGEKLDRLGVTDSMDLPKLVPGLALSRGVLSGGLFVSLRGVGTSSLDSGVDQSIALTIDGQTFTQGLAFASGLFDLAQIEVYKGPQALFYGKASPGGVIALRTADPTDETQVMARVGYEIEAKERRAELVISGPLGETLKGRLAANYSAASGYFKNVAFDNGMLVPGTGGVPPIYKRSSRARNYHIRGTLLWEPSSQFSARLKANLVRDHLINPEGAQLGNCTGGPDEVIPPFTFSFIGGDDCKINRYQTTNYADPAVFPGIINDGIPFIKTTQKYGTLELNYELTPELSLNSTSAYYRMSSENLYGVTAYSVGPVFTPENYFGRKDFTQELRLTSDFSGPLNFTLGAFYQDAWLLPRIVQRGSSLFGFGFYTDAETLVDTNTYSLFGQLRFRVTPELELAAGARWTDEKKSQVVTNNLTNVVVDTITDEIRAKNISPEFTITYTPNDDLTVFAAYKVAYKSGGFVVGTPAGSTVDNSFGDEKVRGGEIGVKARLMERQLNVNVAGYYYKYSGLQVGAIVPPEPGQPSITRIVNAGAARTYGIDFDAAYRPQDIEGLTLNASVNWNNGKYTNLHGIPCWVNQTAALGCDEIFIPSANQMTPPAGTVQDVPGGPYGLYVAQDLSGTPMIRAPKWQANFGFSYEMPFGDGYKLVFDNSNQYSSKMVRYLGVNRPNNDQYQGSFIKVDASVALRGPEDRWEIALIGKNINDKVIAGICSAGNYAAFSSVPTRQGGSMSTAAGLGQTNCFPERGRSLWVRLTFRPFGG